MFDVFLQQDTEFELPECGGIFSKTDHPARRKDLLFHYGEAEIKDSFPISQEIQSAFYLLANDDKCFFALCDDPEKLGRNDLEKYLQGDPDRVSRKDPLVHMKEIVAKPILDLKEDEIKQPTGRVKKFVPRALEYLAGHSEDWRNKSFVGVHPQRLLSLVREDKWETYENRLLYTLCKTLFALINQRLRELKSVEDAYGEIQKYYEIADSIDYEAMQNEINLLLKNYSSKQVDENRNRLNKTIEYLKRLRQTVGAFWNSQLFGNLKWIPNIEVDINQFIMTNILMNNQHYQYLPKIQKEIVGSCAKVRSRQEKFEDQCQLLDYEIKFIKRCIDDFAESRDSLWKFLSPKLTISEIEINLECCSKKLRFSFASSRPSDAYISRMKDFYGDDRTISILVYPQENLYLEEKEVDSLKQLFDIFDNQLPQWGSYSLLGISPQSIFSKLIIQRTLFQWMWPMLITRYPAKIPQGSFINELVSPDRIFENHLFKPCDDSKYKNAADQKERADRVQKNSLRAFHKIRDEDIKVLQNSNELIKAVFQCPCCGQIGDLGENPKPQNFLISCRRCNCRWSRNGDVVKWMKPEPDKLYGKLESFEVKIN
jgi:hypothetical protein